MMVNLKDLPQLSPTELEVMKILWEADGLSAREVHQRIGDHMDWAYSTTRTTIERMVRKGLVAKAPFHGLHIYRASVTRASGLARLVRDLAKKSGKKVGFVMVGLVGFPTSTATRESRSFGKTPSTYT